MSTNPSRRRFFQWTAASMGALAAGRAVRGEAGQLISAAGNTSVDPRRVLLWENTRREFREALEGGTLKAMIVPTGSTEQHNEHLAMIQDTASVTLVAHIEDGLSACPDLFDHRLQRCPERYRQLDAGRCDVPDVECPRVQPSRRGRPDSSTRVGRA